MFENEIELFDSDSDEDGDLIEEEWGLSWDANEINEEESTETNVTACLNVKNANSAVNEKEESLISSPGSKPIERMALNDHKAGMQDLDKEKINKIIHEASKGSKFYENEKRKEQKVKERIEAMQIELNKFNDSDKQKALHESDKVINELKKTMDFSRTLVHVDMDAFYAAVEIRDNLKLKDIPMAVGSNSMLSTSNYAARRFGVRAAMPGFIAKKLCPELVIVPLHFDKYQKVSSEIREIFKNYDLNFAPMSLDEAYLDLTEYMEENCFKYETENNDKELIEIIVEEMRQGIFQKTQLTASAGIAPNMMLSKVCSDMNKPNGQYYLKPDLEVIQDFMKKLPIRKVFGIGKVSEQMLKALGVEVCEDLHKKRYLLNLLFSETTFSYFMRVTLGISSNRIFHDERKSMSAERTFHDVSSKAELLKICYDICEILSKDLAKENLQGRNITLKYKLSSFVLKTRSKTLTYPISKTDEIFSFAKELLLNEIKSYAPEKFELRLMGVRVTHFVDKKEHKQNTVDHFFSANPGPSHAGSETKETIVNSDTIVLEEKELCTADSTSEKDKYDLVQCPVCGISQKNDVKTLNLHIDNCLTKKMIKEIVKEEDVRQLRKIEDKKGKRKSRENYSSGKKATLYSFWNKR